MRKKRTVVIGLLAGGWVVLSFLSGCAGFFEQYDVYATKGQVSNTYSIDALSGNVCVMGAEVPTGNEGYRNTVSNTLTGVLRDQSGKPAGAYEVVSHADFLNLVNQNGLVEEYMQMTDVYNRVAIYPKDSLGLFYQKTGIRFFIKPTLLQLNQRSKTRLSFFSLRLINTKETNAKISAEIWDARTGTKVWEGAAGCTVAGEKFSEKRIAPEKVIGDAWQEMAAKLLCGSD